ncbi:SMI1/KNR4 family protein [Mesorhizobium amorphae]|uniref:SMI1/KNR4 family protein n=1 Tax=Mesorhizobium amorphae TaxID=71433 RepID=UPI001785F5D7|nr:SMI1/KNR4 family protein [Mesorhizobium amorphae]
MTDASSETILAGLRRSLPSSYVDFLKQHDGGEWVWGADLVAIWSAKQLVPFNREYRVETRTPGLLLFGSDGSAEAYGFDLRSPAMSVVRVPFIGMNWKLAIAIAKDFGDWRSALEPRRIDSSRVGMQLAELKPVLLGGDPVDSANKVWLTRDQHFEYVRFWNDVVTAAGSKSTSQ